MGKLNKSSEEKFTPYFRIASVEEYIEDKVDLIKVSAEILPRYTSGLPGKEDVDLDKKLGDVYKENKQMLVNKSGLAIKTLAIEVWTLSEQKGRSNKLKHLKFNLQSEESEWMADHFMLSITFIFKPLMAPVFHDKFAYKGILLSEELNKKK
jgi:hypothetical protein